MTETVIVQVLIRGQGAGLAAAWLASNLTELHERGILMQDEIPMEEGSIDTSPLQIEISTRAPRADEV